MWPVVWRDAQSQPIQLKTSMEGTLSCLLAQGMLVGRAQMGTQIISTVQIADVCPGAGGTFSRLTASARQLVPMEICRPNAVDCSGMCEIWSE